MTNPKVPVLRRWLVTVRWSSGTLTTGTVLATTRGKALAKAWGSDVFNGSTYGEFLKFTRAVLDRSPPPPRWLDPITVLGEPALFVDGNSQYVQFVRPGGEHVLNAHPLDVLPEEYRPEHYRTRPPEVKPAAAVATDLDALVAKVSAKRDEVRALLAEYSPIIDSLEAAEESMNCALENMRLARECVEQATAEMSQHA